MFKSIFYNDIGYFKREPAKEIISESEYCYEYDPRFGEARLTISDSSGYSFAIIKRTTSCKMTRLVREPQYSPADDFDVKNWIFMMTDSEMLDWMIQKYPQVAKRMIWSLDGK